MIAVIDYGAGNLFSVKNALDFLGFESRVTSSAGDLIAADRLILPGVGAFPAAMEKLKASGLVPAILEEAGKKKPLLGICVGMQALFEWGYEFYKTAGLGLIPGEVRAIIAPGLKIPHIGWSDVSMLNPSPLAKGIKDGDRFYFVHSFKAETKSRYVALYTEYGGRVPALVGRDNIFGTQFHPEKSGDLGLKILKNFGELEA